MKGTADDRCEAQHEALLAAERAVLGAMLRDPSCVPQVVAILPPTDFYLPRHATIASAIDHAYKDHGTVDPVLASAVLTARDALQDIGGVPELWALVEECVTAAGFEHHVAIVRGHADRRRLLDVVRRAREAAEAGHPPEEIRAILAEGATIELGRDHRDECAQTVDDVLARWAIDGPLVHQPTGIAGLDEMTGGGLVFGTRTCVQGPPDGCKTLLMLQWASMLSASGVLVGLLAVDEDPDDLVTRLAQRAGFERGACEQRDAKTLTSIRGALDGLRIRFYDMTTTIDAAAADLAAAAKAAGLRSALFVDSIQTARCAAENPDRSRHEAVTARVASCGIAARRYRHLVVFSSEMNRQSYKTEKRDETLSEMGSAKESGSIEYGVKVLLSVRAIDNDNLELRIIKNKLGPRHAPKEGISLRVDRAGQRLTEGSPPPAFEKPKTDEIAARDQAELESNVALVVANLRRLRSATSKDEACTGSGVRLTKARIAFDRARTIGVIVNEGTERKKHFVVAERVCERPPVPPASGTPDDVPDGSPASGRDSASRTSPDDDGTAGTADDDDAVRRDTGAGE